MSKSLRGQFLIACPRLRDCNFYKTVVLVVEHNKDGAMGVIVNRPSSVTVAHALSEHFKLPETDDLVYVGGPVEPSALFILHNESELDEEETAVVPGLYVGSSAGSFERVICAAAHGDLDLDFRIFSGCAGWGSGQLEGELARGDWYTQPATAETIFYGDPYELWDDLVQKVHESNRILPHTTPNPELN